jgi:hypothetical protein
MHISFPPRDGKITCKISRLGGLVHLEADYQNYNTGDLRGDGWL